MTVKSTVRSAVRSAIRGTVRSGGALLPEWTPIYDGLTTFAEYYANFTPTGSNSTLEIVFYKQGSKIQTIAFGDASAFSIALDASDVLTFNLISNVELNGVPATSGVTTVPDGYYVLTGDLDITSDIKYYAANATPANFFGIQIHSMKNIDNDDPSNSIDINTVKRSKDAPSASDNLLINSLGSVGDELLPQPVDLLNAPWASTASATIESSTSFSATSAGGVFANLASSLQGKVATIRGFITVGNVNSVSIKDSVVASGADPTIVSFPAEFSGEFEFTHKFENGGIYFRVAGIGSADIANISARETTRNIGEIKNMVGYELVNRGE